MLALSGQQVVAEQWTTPGALVMNTHITGLAVARSLGGAATPFNKLWRVRTGPFSDAKSAAQARDAVAARGYGDARVVRED